MSIGNQWYLWTSAKAGKMFMKKYLMGRLANGKKPITVWRQSSQS